MTRVVVLSPVVPFEGVAHAGGYYLHRLHQSLDGFDMTFLVPDVAQLRADAERPGAPDQVLFLGDPARTSFFRRAVMRLAERLDASLSFRNPTWPWIPYLIHALGNRDARRALREAEVIDLQWPENSRFAPAVRILNPKARIIVTPHDVLSQRYGRRLNASYASDDLNLERIHASALKLEAATLRIANTILVFSDKDRRLLLDSAVARVRAAVEVVDPPLAPEIPTARNADPLPTVVFVGLLNRSENEDAVTWLVGDIWPLVSQRVPEARLLIAGVGASSSLQELTDTRGDVELMGFVAHLDDFYSKASACVVPLRFGAGVKFKSIEALIAGLPIVATTVGAEGIPHEHFVAVVDDARGVADALVRVLQAPKAYDPLSATAKDWAMQTYDRKRFRRRIRDLYEARKPA